MVMMMEDVRLHDVVARLVTALEMWPYTCDIMTLLYRRTGEPGRPAPQNLAKQPHRSLQNYATRHSATAPEIKQGT